MALQSASASPPRSARVWWRDNGQPYDNSVRDTFAGNISGLQLSFASGPMTCGIGTSSGQILRAGATEKVTNEDCSIGARDCTTPTKTPGLVTIRTWADQLFLADSGNVVLRIRLHSEFACVVGGVLHQYELHGVLLQDMGVGLGVPKTQYSVTAVTTSGCQTLGLTDRVRRRVSELAATLSFSGTITLSNPAQEPSVDPLAFGATGGGESFPAKCGKIVGD